MIKLLLASLGWGMTSLIITTVDFFNEIRATFVRETGVCASNLIDAARWVTCSLTTMPQFTWTDHCPIFANCITKQARVC
jgi:hypothetical protein